MYKFIKLENGVLTKFASLLIIFTIILLPSLVMGLVWSMLNFYWSVFLLAIFFMVNRYYPTTRTISCVIIPALMTVPPYPNWYWFTERQDWHFHVGAKLINFHEYYLSFILMYLFMLAAFILLARWVNQNTNKENLENNA